MSSGATQIGCTIVPLQSSRANWASGCGMGPGEMPYGASSSSGANTSDQAHPSRSAARPPRNEVTTSSPPDRTIVTRTASSTVSTSSSTILIVRAYARGRVSHDDHEHNDERPTKRLTCQSAPISVTFHTPSMQVAA